MGNNSSIVNPRPREHAFRSEPLYDQPAVQVDREQGILFGVQIIREGVAKGHGVRIDNEFVNDVATQGNAKSNGLKSRFNHPNMSVGALGTYLGQFRNFRTEGTSTFADLHLDASAKTTPSGDLHSYVLDLAENAPSEFGASISFQDDGEQYGYDANGAKLPTHQIENYDGDIFLRLSSLHAADLVDDPAATDGLFSAQVNTHAFAVQASEFLDANPEIWQFVERHPDKLQPFLEKYRAYCERRALNSTTKPPMKKKSILARMWAALTAAGKSFDIAVTDTDGNKLSILTDSDTPAIGDEVLLMPTDSAEPGPAPDGNYVVAEGADNAGDTITVAEGKIADIVPAVVEEPTPQPTDDPIGDVSMSALSAQLTQLQAQFDAMRNENTRLQAENDRLQKEPAASHTDVDAEDFTKGAEKPEFSFNQAGKEIFEKAKRNRKK